MSNYKNGFVTSGKTRFVNTPVSEVEHSKMVVYPRLDTTFNAGDIVPIYCNEVLPGDSFSMDLESVIRLPALKVPFSGELYLDIYAYFVPNRIVNESWKNVQGENTSGYWVAPDVSLVPLHNGTTVQIPVGSVADFYGFPTQMPIKGSVLMQCHDLKFRGYLEIYNNYFRDQNYQPPIPYSKLNVYNGFLEPVGASIALDGIGPNDVFNGHDSDGTVFQGAVVKSLYGEGSEAPYDFTLPYRLTSWSALDKPLKANKMHDYFTSGLPSPQKGPAVEINVASTSELTVNPKGARVKGTDALQLFTSSSSPAGYKLLTAFSTTTSQDQRLEVLKTAYGDSSQPSTEVTGTNLKAFVENGSFTFTLDDLRTSAAVQRVYETLARGGSRYIEYIASMFGIETENPFKDIPTRLGHIRLNLDMYQTAQTSATQADSPQGNLAAYSYTDKNGHLFTHTFLEHGYVHCFAVVRHRNVYTTLLSRDNFRLNSLDFYQPPLANISEQPVYSREINPTVDNGNADGAFCYQEAWAEYRHEPDRVTSYARSGIDGSLSMWNLCDDFNSTLEYMSGDWLKSNTEEILNRSLTVPSTLSHQIKGFFQFKIVKDRPMPVYSVPGMDII